MNKTEKSDEIRAISERFNKASAVILSEYAGLNGETLRQLRVNVRKADGEFKVMKNRLVQKAIENTEYKPILEYFEGPIGVVFGYHDPIGSIKAAKEFSEKQKAFKLKGGMMEGRLLDVKGIQQVASLPGRSVMIGQLLSRMQSPLYGFVGTLNGVINKFVYALSAVKEKKEAAGV
ncbi:MAG: 50S ribosomal protein L10 [Nitrospirae bacterium]|nr:50S ribosomal protein L10 [Nitrospirota bacterium]MBI3594641.1 50S ribosomal protein L10 [Nitrospirota bacterium]